MKRRIEICLAALLCLGGCDSSQPKPSAPPVPDIALPAEADAGPAEPDGAQAANAGDGGAAPMEDSKSPIVENMIGFLPDVLDGSEARRRQSLKTAVHGFYEGEKGRIYNVQIAGPSENEAKRRGTFPMLGKEEVNKRPDREIRGLKIAGFDAQRTYHNKKQKSETVVLVNPFVLVKLNVAPTKDADESVKLLEQVDLEGISKLR